MSPEVNSKLVSLAHAFPGKREGQARLRQLRRYVREGF